MVIRAHSRTLFAIAFAILHDREEAEDVVQETFVKAFRSRWRIRKADRLPGWLSTVARNRALDLLRRRRPIACPEPAAVDSAPRAADAADAEETRELLHRTLATLPETHRIALTLRYLEGLDHKAIQQAMGLSDGALRGILGRGLATMRKALKPSTSPALE